MKPNWYEIIGRAVEEGITSGWNRAHKHNEAPDENSIKEAICEEVINNISEVVDWEQS